MKPQGIGIRGLAAVARGPRRSTSRRGRCLGLGAGCTKASAAAGRRGKMSLDIPFYRTSDRRDDETPPDPHRGNGKPEGECCLSAPYGSASLPRPTRRGRLWPTASKHRNVSEARTALHFMWAYASSSSGFVVFHLPRVKSGKSTAALFAATDRSVSGLITLHVAAS